MRKDVDEPAQAPGKARQEVSQPSGQRDMTSAIQTVQGLLDPSSVGVTLLHEHVLFDLNCLYSPLPDGDEGPPVDHVSAQTLGWIRHHAYNSADNLRSQSVDRAVTELERFGRAGGGMIVDVTSTSIGRNPEGLRRVSEATSVPIVMGCGYYVARSHPERLDHLSIDDLAQEFIGEIRTGVGTSGIRAGIIGEIGLSDPPAANELKCVRAAAIAQRETGAAIVVHSPTGAGGPFVAADLLEEADSDPSRVVISHLDARFGKDPDPYARLADRGFVLGLDTFGRDIYIDFMSAQLPNDSSRIAAVKALTDLGLANQIILSQDICLKMELTEFGGYGYGHILENLWQRFLRAGVDESQLDLMISENPKRLLSLNLECSTG